MDGSFLCFFEWKQKRNNFSLCKAIYFFLLDSASSSLVDLCKTEEIFQSSNVIADNPLKENSLVWKQSAWFLLMRFTVHTGYKNMIIFRFLNTSNKNLFWKIGLWIIPKKQRQDEKTRVTYYTHVQERYRERERERVHDIKPYLVPTNTRIISTMNIYSGYQRFSSRYGRRIMKNR